MKKYFVGLLFVAFFSTISFAEDRFYLEGYNDITDNIISSQITKADITILGIEFYNSGCYSFKHCYKPMVLNSDTANSFAIDFSGFSNCHNEKRREYNENDFNISVSFDLQLWPAADGRIYGAKFIPTKVSNAKTTFKGKLIKYEYPTNSAYGDFITRKDFPESTVGPYEMKEVDYKKGFKAKCDNLAHLNDIPMVLKPYAQNIIYLENTYLIEKSMYFYCDIVDEDGNKTNQSTSYEFINFSIYAVVNSLTFKDGTTKTFNTEKIDEKSWFEQNNKYEKKLPWEGKGTSDSPFLIKNLNDLIALNTEYKYIDGGYYFKQEADITISNNDFWGKPQDKLLLYYYEKPFTGCYDGNGKSITGLKIVTSDKELTTVPQCPYNDFHGLFHRVRNAEIKNLTINCEIDIGENNKAGALAGEAINATFTNIIVNAKVNGKESIGGLIGEAKNVTFKDFTVNSDNINGKKFVGGILGKGEKITADNINIKNASVKGEEYVGGAFGKIEKNCKLTNIFTDVNLTAKKFCGGVVGSIKDYCSAKGLSAEGKVTGETIVGGVFGEIYGNSKKEDKPDLYSDFVSKAEVTATKGNAGGIVCQINENASLSDCINYGSILGKFTGGIASLIGVYGKNEKWGLASVTRCENHGELKTSAEIVCIECGGIACDLKMNNYLTDCYNDANAEGKERCGGIVANNDRAYIQNCYAIGQFTTGEYNTHVGGIAGRFFPPKNKQENTVIKDCFITSDTKLKYKSKINKKNNTNGCIGEEPDYKDCFSNLQYFASVSDIKLDSSWNPEVWAITPGSYPIIKRDVIGGVVYSYESVNESPKEENKEVKEDNSTVKPVETQAVENKIPVETKEAQPEKSAENTKTEAAPAPEKTKPEAEKKPSFDTKEYKPIELKPIQTHPNVKVPEELELEP